MLGKQVREVVVGNKQVLITSQHSKARFYRRRARTQLELIGIFVWTSCLMRYNSCDTEH